MGAGGSRTQIREQREKQGEEDLGGCKNQKKVAGNRKAERQEEDKWGNNTGNTLGKEEKTPRTGGQRPTHHSGH